jgi:hypothetical protein
MSASNTGQFLNMASLDTECGHGFDHDQQTIPDPIIPISKRLCQLLVAMLPPYFGSTLVTIEYWFNKVDNLEIPDSNQMDPDQHRHPSFNKRGEQLPMMLCTRQSHKERRCLPLTW